jgi:hypothetical protein
MRLTERLKRRFVCLPGSSPTAGCARGRHSSEVWAEPKGR